MTFSDTLRLLIYGFSAGIITSCGYFALFMTVGVVNRFVQFTHTADKEKLYENVIIIGVILGSFLCMYKGYKIIPQGILTVYFLFAGCFSGCFLLSLAEATKGIPVFIRRSRLRTGFVIIIMFLALGKGLGSLFYFCS